MHGNSYVTGFFFGRSTFGAGEDNETVLTATGSWGEAEAELERLRR